MAQSRTHIVCVTLHFPAPVTGRQAADAFKAEFRGTFPAEGLGMVRIGRVKTIRAERN